MYFKTAVLTLLTAIYFHLWHVNVKEMPVTDEQERAVQRALPHGCQLINLGEYGRIRQLIVIECSDRNSTTTESEDEDNTIVVIKPIF